MLSLIVSTGLGFVAMGSVHKPAGTTRTLARLVLAQLHSQSQFTGVESCFLTGEPIAVSSHDDFNSTSGFDL